MATKKPTRKRSSSKTPQKSISKQDEVLPSGADPIIDVTGKKPNSRRSRSRYFTIAAVVVLVLAGAVYLLKNQLFSAVVNGQLVTRWQVLSKLEKQYGSQTLDSIVTRMLVEQDAAKKHIVLSQDDIDSEVKKIETQLTDQGMQLDSALAAQGMTRAEFIEEVEFRMFLEKLLEEKIAITDEEVAKFMDENKAYLAQNADSTKAAEQAREQLKNEKLSSEASTYIEELKKQASIQYFSR